uniref:Uncharacterized protein n=1 Tax=Timema monikensis TaxID=170555 RepID=A0A7R9E654_9NEOP|nr:unnamed protein product [Timema monikensis]
MEMKYVGKILQERPRKRWEEQIIESVQARGEERWKERIDNRNLTLNMDNAALCVSQFADGKWKPRDKSSFSLARNSLDTAATLIQRQTYAELIDFDNHLDDISQDWRNPSLNLEVDEEAGTVG